MIKVALAMPTSDMNDLFDDDWSLEEKDTIAKATRFVYPPS